MAPNEIIVSNPSRRVVPAAIAASLVVMFLPPLLFAFFESGEPGKAAAGAAGVMILACWFAYRAFRAPIEARFGPSGLALRGSRTLHYEMSQLRDWFFAVRVGPPTRAAPGTNALINLTMRDGTRFRGEVTSDEATRLADWLPRAANTIPAAD